MYGTDCAGLSPPKMVIVYEMVPAGHTRLFSTSNWSHMIAQCQPLVTHDCSVSSAGA